MTWQLSASSFSLPSSDRRPIPWYITKGPASQPASRARETHQLNFFSSSSSCYAKGDSISLLPVRYRFYDAGLQGLYYRTIGTVCPELLLDRRERGRECGAQQKNIKEVRRRRKRKEKLSIHRSSASCVLPTLISEPYST